jgi:putative endonuclease
LSFRWYLPPRRDATGILMENNYFITKKFMKHYYVYILASRKIGVLYIWVTNNIIRRIREHQDRINRWFTKKYRVKKLVYYERRVDINEAIIREKQLKKWKRQRKINLIKKENPNWEDLSIKFIRFRPQNLTPEWQ